MGDLTGLIERVEKLDGPSDLLDAEIYATVGGAPHATTAGDRIIPLIKKGDPTKYPAYTASLDAAIALVERCLPGMWRSIEWAGTNRPPSEWPVVEFGIGDFKDKVQAKTAPIALLLALLRAMQKEERT